MTKNKKLKEDILEHKTLANNAKKEKESIEGKIE